LEPLAGEVMPTTTQCVSPRRIFRINKDDFLWWNTPLTCTGYRFMVREVATHERGHNFGLADIDESTHGNLTMSKNVNAPCMQTAYSLGRGDVYGIRDIYDNP
jgi:hypothetical protein